MHYFINKYLLHLLALLYDLVHLVALKQSLCIGFGNLDYIEHSSIRN